jgi:hypothetical protein
MYSTTTTSKIGIGPAPEDRRRWAPNQNRARDRDGREVDDDAAVSSGNRPSTRPFRWLRSPCERRGAGSAHVLRAGRGTMVTGLWWTRALSAGGTPESARQRPGRMATPRPRAFLGARVAQGLVEEANVCGHPISLQIRSQLSTLGDRAPGPRPALTCVVPTGFHTPRLTCGNSSSCVWACVGTSPSLDHALGTPQATRRGESLASRFSPRAAAKSVPEGRPRFSPKATPTSVALPVGNHTIQRQDGARGQPTRR